MKKKLLAALLPVVAFAAFALAPALAQASQKVTLKEGNRTLEVGDQLKFNGGSSLFFTYWTSPQCDVELTGVVTENPGATIEITESHFESPNGGRCHTSASYPTPTYEPTMSPGHTFKVTKIGTIGSFQFNEVPTHFDFYNGNSELACETDTSLYSEGEWKVGTSIVFLGGSYLEDESHGCQLKEFGTEAYFLVTALDGTTKIKIE